MPAIPAPGTGSTPPKVLVTGANGYIAMWVVRTLLEKGYAVRGTVRNEKKVEDVRKVFETGVGSDVWKGRVEWVVVEDFTKEGAFDEAVKGVDGIAHMAAPLNTETDDPDEYIKPAVSGALGVLQSALKFGPTVKRVAITSSVTAAVSMKKKPPPSGPLTFTEEDWADEAVETIKKDGRKAGDHIKYRASKVLAERAAFEFVEKHKAEIGFDITTLIPPFVVGPTLLSPAKPTDLNASLNRFYRTLFTEESDDFLKSPFGYIDVRDAALAHVLALTKDEAGGERIIIMGGGVTWQTARDVAYEIDPKLYESGILPRGKPDLPKDIMYSFSNEKGKRILGIEYRTLEETVGDVLADFEGRGWAEKKAE